MLAKRSESQLLVIDVQQKLAPHIADGDAVIENCARLVRYARRMGVPATITEHYPKGLGKTAAPVADAAGNDTPCLEKIAFSCWRDDCIHNRLRTFVDKGRQQIIVAGMETHVCVGQTVLDLRSAGHDVMLVADAVGSRQARTRDIAIERMRDAGVAIVTQEMIAFEWLERGDAAEVKDILALLK